ncbi:MAG: zinc ribbon domain-containing protein [Methanobrevibacter sp.]|nr:zinc ribbon domain-containing protein [Methanobrevibacter sp.]
MDKESDYVERLEKIIDKQDDLLTHLDAKFDQQQSINDNLTKQNLMLKEDIKKHKDLLIDMNKSVNQHKNVVKKLKKELEEQLKIQQDLHKDYGEVIQGLTDELEEEKNKNTPNNKPAEVNEKKDKPSKSDKVELPPKEHKVDYVSSASNMFNDIKEKSSDVVNDVSNQNASTNNVKKDEGANEKFCKNCGTKVQEGYIFCDSCGTKLD